VHVGKFCGISEFLVWTRRDIYVLVAISVVPVLLYRTAELQWLGVPWTAVALLGTPTAFIVGFKSIQMMRPLVARET
jgi:putative membrane protein